MSRVLLSEVSFQDSFKPAIGKRHGRGFLLRFAANETHATMLPTVEPATLRLEVLIASEDATEHTAWQREFYGNACCVGHPSSRLVGKGVHNAALGRGASCHSRQNLQQG